MPVSAFISYSHADEKALDRLHKHLAMLRRDELLSAWSDHAILPGSSIGQTIDAQLEGSGLFLALVSPDYLASRYCYEKEFERALELSRAGRMRIVPIILEPCDWLASPLSEYMALPKDGKPVSEWTNANNAYLDIVTGLRRLLEVPVVGSGGQSPAAGMDGRAPARKLKLQRDFDSIEKAEFADRAFGVIRDYFQKASAELMQASEDLRTRVQDMSPTAFTASLVNRAKLRQGESHITVHNHKRRGGFGDISYSYEAHASDNTSNGAIRVEADDYNLFLNVDGYMGGSNGTKYTPERAAEWLWNEYVGKAGIEYE
ncbi:MAG TPA: toll/interleukin-1 receptor domain-containing protein [Caulobacteraceae bacterium]